MAATGLTTAYFSSGAGAPSVAPSVAAGEYALYQNTTNGDLYEWNLSGTPGWTKVYPPAATSSTAYATKTYGPDTTFLSAGAATSLTAIDTTNLRLAIPGGFGGGNILVRVSCLCQSSGTGNKYWGILEGGTTVAIGWLTNDTSTISRREMTFLLSSVSAGAHNYDFAYSNSAGSLNMYASPLTGGTNKWGLALMEAWLA